MSYCRFSSNDWQSDVYVYGTLDETWMVHVAARRHVFKVPLPEPVSLRDDPGAWAKRSVAIMDMLDDSEKCALEEINLPYANETFECQSPGEAANRLQELAALGYHVPDGVIDDLRQEQLEMESA